MHKNLSKNGRVFFVENAKLCCSEKVLKKQKMENFLFLLQSPQKPRINKTNPLNFKDSTQFLNKISALLRMRQDAQRTNTKYKYWCTEIVKFFYIKILLNLFYDS